MMNEESRDKVSITLDEITLRFGDMEPVVIPRSTLRTRLQLIEWVYRLTAWRGMDLQRLRTFIAAIFAHHGWALPEANTSVPIAAPSYKDRAEPVFMHAAAA
jgi:hypothetical protein